MTIVMILAGFLLLIKGADWLVEGASTIAYRLNVPPLVVGLTIVAFGTSAPEFIVNMVAAVSGNTEVAAGNILGSNILNILLILGISALINPIIVQRVSVKIDIPISFFAAAVVFVLGFDHFLYGASVDILSRLDGIVMLACFSGFLLYAFWASKTGTDTKDEQLEKTRRTMSLAVALVVGGLVALVVGGKWVVTAAVAIAESLGISERVIGLTIVALGTSLPELATSAVAAWKKNHDIAIGNIVGSNIFNIFFILGTTAIITPVPLVAGSLFDVAMTALASVVLYLSVFRTSDRLISRPDGIFFVTLYGAYVVFLIAG